MMAAVPALPSRLAFACALAALLLALSAAPASAGGAPPTCSDLERNATQGVPIYFPPTPETPPACSDPEGDPLFVSLVQWPQYGTIGYAPPPAPPGTVQYVAFFGPATEDSFTFRASDGTSYSNLATATIHITPSDPETNRPPVCPSATVFVPSDGTVDVFGNCVDPEGAALSYLIVSGPTSGSIEILSASSLRYTPGPDPVATLVYSATDNVHAPVQATVTINVVPPGTTTYSTPATDPVQAAVESPLGGPVVIDTRAVSAPPPTGFFFLGQEFDITAPPTDDPLNPLELAFTVTSPPPGELKVFRDDVLVGDCEAPGATPDPCVAARIGTPPDPVTVQVRTTHASRWNLGVGTAYDFTGFFSPVNGLPTLNAVKSGSAVPVKFSLDGDQGLDVLADGYPRSESIDCDSDALVDGIESTVNAGSSSLTYDAATDQYTYVWKTSKDWTGCRQLVVQLDDGTKHRANFLLK